MSGDAKLFFVHLMKTGGSSFVARLRTCISEGQMYPNAIDDDMPEAYTSIDDLRTLTAERRARIEVYSGHFPYIASQLVGEPVWTATILREPLSRTVSYLKHARRLNTQFQELTLEQVYDDPWKHPMLIRNYQAKLFAMTLDDRLETQLDVIEVDEERLESAIRHLEDVDVLGLHERYDDFVTAAARIGGWEFEPVRRWHVGEPEDVPASLVERILEDNEMEVRFYEHAVRLVDQRSR